MPERHLVVIVEDDAEILSKMVREFSRHPEIQIYPVIRVSDFCYDDRLMTELPKIPDVAIIDGACEIGSVEFNKKRLPVLREKWGEGCLIIAASRSDYGNQDLIKAGANRRIGEGKPGGSESLSKMEAVRMTLDHLGVKT